MSEDHGARGMHLDVLVADQFSKFVADDLEPDLVVGAFKDRINLGIDSRDGTVDVYLGNLSPGDARALADALVSAATAVETATVAEGGQSWTIDESGNGS